MNDLTIMLTTLIGSGPIAYFIGLFIGRKKKKAEDSDALVVALQNLQKAYNDTLESFKGVATSNVQLMSENADLKTAVDERDNIIEKLKKQIEQLTSQIERLNSEIESLKRQVKINNQAILKSNNTKKGEKK